LIHINEIDENDDNKNDIDNSNKLAMSRYACYGHWSAVVATRRLAES